MTTRSDTEKFDDEIATEICERLDQEDLSPEALADELARLHRSVRAIAARLTVIEILRSGEAREPVERPNIGDLRKVIAEKEPGAFVLLTQDEATHLCDYIEFLESRPGQK